MARSLQETGQQLAANQDRFARAGNIFSQLAATREQHAILTEAHQDGQMSDEDFDAYMDDASRVLPPAISGAIKRFFGG